MYDVDNGASVPLHTHQEAVRVNDLGPKGLWRKTKERDHAHEMSQGIRTRGAKRQQNEGQPPETARPVYTKSIAKNTIT